MHCTTHDHIKKYMGRSQQNANEFPDVFTTRTIQPVDSNMTYLAFNILMATGTKLVVGSYF